MSYPTVAEFSLIIPTYNEAENIVILLPKIISALNQYSNGFEIIVVDDNSPDLTWKVVKDYFASDARVKIIRRFGSKDLSTAVLTGMGSANGKYLGVMDADLQHDESLLISMLKEIKTHDIVIGSRMLSENGYGDFKKRRKFISQVATWVTKKLLRVDITDPMSGFFIITRSVFENTANRINPRGFKILLEFISRNSGLKIKELSYTFRERIHGKTKLSIHVAQHFLFSVLDIWSGNYFSPQFIRYAIVGLSGIIVNLFGQWIGQDILGWKEHGLIYKSYLFPSFAVALGFELSVFSNYLLNNIWTFQEKMIKGLANFSGFIRFHLVSLTGFIIQLAVWRFILGYFQHSFQNFIPEYITYISNLLGIIAATSWNYYLNRNFTWSFPKIS